MKAKGKLLEVEFARAFAMFAVLFVHGTSTALTNLDAHSTLYPLYALFNTIGKLGVPVFFMLSSLVLFYTYFPKELNGALFKEFYKKRLKYVVLPYVSFSMIYFSIKLLLYYDFASVTEGFLYFFNLLITGKAHAHLYFLFVLIQFYLIFPILLIILKKVTLSPKFFILSGILIQWGWVYANKHYFQVPYKGSVFLSYMAFFILGAIWGIYYQSFRQWFMDMTSKKRFYVGYGVTTIYLASLVAIFHFDYKLRVYKELAYTSFLPEWATGYLSEFLWFSYGFISSIALIFISLQLLLFNWEKVNAFLIKLASLSFGIYLVHPLFLMFLREVELLNQTSVRFNIWQMITFALMFIGSWVFTLLISKKVKFSWIIIGK